LFPVLRGLYNFHLVRGTFRIAHELGGSFCAWPSAYKIRCFSQKPTQWSGRPYSTSVETLLPPDIILSRGWSATILNNIILDPFSTVSLPRRYSASRREPTPSGS